MSKINPPQFRDDDSKATRAYKERQFVEDVIRQFDELSDEVASISSGGGGGGSGGGGYPAQLGYMGVR